MQELTQDQQKLFNILTPDVVPTADEIANVLQSSMMTSEEIAKVISLAIEAWYRSISGEFMANNELRNQIRDIKEKIADWWLEGR